MHRIRKTIHRYCAALMMVAGLVPAATGARAAVPNVWGFAYVDALAGPPPAAHQGLSPAGVITSAWTLPNLVEVTFPTIPLTDGVVHVTAVSPKPEWCQVAKWGPGAPGLSVQVRCYKYGGAPVFVPFTIVYEQSSGTLSPPEAVAYLYYDGASVASSYNSTAGVNSVAAGPVGVWTVTLPGLPTTPTGNLQVTAVDPAQPARCKVGNWTPSAAGQVVEVRCFDATSKPLKTGWTLSYTRQRAITGGAKPPKYFAYTMDESPTTPGPYPPSSAWSYNSSSGPNTVQDALPFRWVRFPGVGVLPDDVQVTAFGPGPEYCQLGGLWSVSGAIVDVNKVACFNGTAFTKQRTFVTYTSAT
ncbi:hypothetical protein IL992_02980 [Microbispora sp. NEAU-D428]|uniref:hypothetical protein n=1 Tax=Microbispora sitophila TaxID=2771537 RepID=UPI001865ADBB|nr:hypothetical protein [Microbispora sitophila]MBE3008155.1 hypothetical protein [Microbispora sitophila]